ncbi:MAG: pyridoxal phosphate-dependent decarboxylase family protein [Geminicoccaceae bacterium]
MDIATFRRHGHELIDRIADYWQTIEDRPVRAQTEPGAIKSQLPAAPPEQGEPFDQVMADFERIVMPGITHWQHPRFFAYFPANISPPSVLAEFLTAALGANAMLWQTSPAATELETHCLDWLRQAIGLPAGFQGVIQDTASSATLCALLTARELATGGEANQEGLSGLGPLFVYTSAQAHSSVEKNARIAGFGDAGLRRIETDPTGAMRPDLLEAAVREDQRRGRRPAAVVATLGTTATGAVDPILPIADICRRFDLFLHVDAAWAGSALICPEWRHLLPSADGIDSIVFNPHKWLGVQFDCSAYFVRNSEWLIRTFQVMPSYLQSRETGEVIDYRDWGIPLGRRFRALKLWFVLRCYGLDGLRTIIRQHIAWAHEFAGWVDESPDFELVTPVTLGLVCFRYRPRCVSVDQLDALNRTLIDRVNDEGTTYLTGTDTGSCYAIRVSIGPFATEQRHVQGTWETIQALAREISV